MPPSPVVLLLVFVLVLVVVAVLSMLVRPLVLAGPVLLRILGVGDRGGRRHKGRVNRWREVAVSPWVVGRGSGRVRFRRGRG